MLERGGGRETPGDRTCGDLPKKKKKKKKTEGGGGVERKGERHRDRTCGDLKTKRREGGTGERRGGRWLELERVETFRNRGGGGGGAAERRGGGGYLERGRMGPAKAEAGLRWGVGWGGRDWREDGWTRHGKRGGRRRRVGG